MAEHERTGLARDLGDGRGEARDRSGRTSARRERWRARDAQLAAIVDQATVGIAQADLDGRFMLVNQRYCHWPGAPPTR